MPPSLPRHFFDPKGRFTLIAGPCQMESEAHALDMAQAIAAIATKHQVPLVYKSSFDKANRTSLGSARGLGLEASVPVFDKVRDQLGLPVLTDVHAPEQCAALAAHIDVLQIPAFLCRQSDLLIAAARTGRTVNVKKGQFLSPWEMEHVAAKLTQSGLEAHKVLLCERGTSFGYNNLVNDFKGLPIMKALGHPVIFDATHSVMQPGALGGASGGNREFVPVLARAALAVGVAGLFMEVHDNPEQAPSDGPNMVPLDQLDALLATLVKFDDLAKAEL